MTHLNEYFRIMKDKSNNTKGYTLMDHRIYIIQVLQEASAFSTMFKNTF